MATDTHDYAATYEIPEGWVSECTCGHRTEVRHTSSQAADSLSDHIDRAGRMITETTVLDEDEFENCVSIRGGAVHTATPQFGPEVMHILPLCRTGAQNHLRTRYMLTKLDITCRNCIAIRERRAARRAAAEPA